MAHASKDRTRKLTPPQVAARLAVGVDKVRHWIASGELPAIDVARKIGGRPRFRVDVNDLEAFEQRRLVQPQTRLRSRSRRQQADIIEFF
ncbi:MAG TPA: helix-turn-helix domain-containing protein [Planctomycetaceae bacterium]|jgi:excisionase family DNA binding protein|nr:helix-turn-helix domain-containing protein [Planctomycetaceae bacterium]